jgi:hypothetical protein
MSKLELAATETVRVDGVWRQVEVYINTLQLASNMAPRAARSKSNSARARFGAIRIKVLPAGTVLDPR